MQHIQYIFFLFTFSVFTQQPVEASFVKKSKLDAQALVGVDNFETLFYINNNVLYKNLNGNSINFSHIQLGNITSVNIFNPLKINVFYSDFNTVVILDNRLTEITRIDFNRLQPFRNISHISTGNDNTIWIYNQDTQELEIFDYKANKTKVKTLPIQGDVLDIKSDFNLCWLLTKDYLYKYNYVGSFLSKIKNKGFTKLVQANKNLILQKENQLFYIAKDLEIFTELKIPKLLIKQFLVTNETLYIYDEEFLHEYRLKIN